MTPRMQFVINSLNLDTKDCIIFPRHNPKDYFIFWEPNLRKQIRAHNFVCKRKHGLPPNGKENACHSCNVKGCINWRHIRWGSHKNNTDDYSKVIGRKIFDENYSDEKGIRTREHWFCVIQNVHSRKAD